jgi:hypothetical protein
LPTENIEWTRVQRLGFALTTASIWAANDHDIYVGQPTSERFGDVGLIDQSRLFHFDGVNWTELNISDPKEFGDTRVWGVDENNVYVAIKKLRHFNGITWSEEPIDAGIVTGTAANNVFAAAGNAVFHFTGVEWDTLLTLNQGYIRGLSAADDGSLWATTYDSVIVWNNATWSSVQWPADVYYGLQGLVAFSATSALAVRPYDRYYDPDSKIYRWDGNQWTVDAVFSQSSKHCVPTVQTTSTAWAQTVPSSTTTVVAGRSSRVRRASHCARFSRCPVAMSSQLAEPAKS